VVGSSDLHLPQRALAGVLSAYCEYAEEPEANFQQGRAERDEVSGPDRGQRDTRERHR